MAVRPIIFRGKRKDNGEWVEGSLIIAKNFCCILQDEEKVHPFDYPYLGNESGCIDGYATPVIPETVGQYTGLTDKNGKKIFEGDILKPPCWYWHIYRCVCIYREEHQTGSIQGFGLYHKINDWVELVDTDEWDEFEVIGNIYDNPELLEDN